MLKAAENQRGWEKMPLRKARKDALSPVCNKD